MNQKSEKIWGEPVKIKQSNFSLQIKIANIKIILCWPKNSEHCNIQDYQNITIIIGTLKKNRITLVN